MTLLEPETIVTNNHQHHHHDDERSMTLAERMAALNEGPIFLDRGFLWKTVFPQIVWTFATLSLIYITALYMANRWATKGTSQTAKRKASYQFTNLCANSVLSIAGLYFEYFVLPKNPTEEETTQGLENVIFMSTFQFGYQLWAIPVGVFYVRESTAMLVHHSTVLIVSSVTTFLRNGFRYWSPFFYGVIELSSIPLAIMNFMKDHPSLIDRYPDFYTYMRIIFCLVFLQVRVVMYIPRVHIFLRDHFLLYSTHPNMLFRIYMSSVTISSLLLLILQLYWGVLVVKGLWKGYLKLKPFKSKAA